MAIPHSSCPPTSPGIMTLAIIPQDIMLEIAEYLDLGSMTSLMLTCKAIYSFVNTKPPWVILYRNFAHIRPVTLPTTRCFASLSLLDIKRPLQHAFALDHNFKREVVSPIGHPKVFALSPPPPSDDLSQVIWVWILPQTHQLLSMSHEGKLRCWDLQTGQISALHNLGGPCMCWEVGHDANGVTIIVNVEGPSGRDSVLQVIRLIKSNTASTGYEFSHVVDYPVDGTVRSNILQGDIACVVCDRPRTKQIVLYIINWKTGESLQVHSNLQIDGYLSGAASAREIFVYGEGSTSALLHTYLLSDLAPHLSNPEQSIFLPPRTHQTAFQDQGLQHNLQWIPTTRTRWDGRKCAISLSMNPDDLVGDTVTFHLLEGEDAPIPRLLIEHIPAPGLMIAPQGWRLISLGQRGINAAWIIDKDDSVPDSVATMQLATFGTDSVVVRTLDLKMPDLLDRTRVVSLELDDELGIMAIGTVVGEIFVFSFV